MSRLEDLLQELCPDGVQNVKIGDIVKVLRGKRLTKDALNKTDPYPVFHGGIEPLGFFHEKNRESNTVMIINVGASAGTVGYCEKEFWSSDGCFCLSHSDTIIPKYAYYVLANGEKRLMSKVRKAGIPTLDSAVIEDYLIPVPPLPVQEEIVRILDNFAELTASLTAELQARKKQYEHYRTALFENVKGHSDKKVLSSVCTIEKGMTPIQKAVPGEYPLVVTTSERKTCCDYQFDSDSVCIPLVSSRGHGVASLNHVYYQTGKFALGNILCAVTPKDDTELLARYLYYYFEHSKDYTLVPLMKGGANVALHTGDIEKIRVPVPSIEVQKEIINSLNTFEQLCNSVLPAEIEARQKQYEYYRDKLLTFKEKA